MEREGRGNVFTLRYDSHFSWQRNENGPSKGIADGISRGRDMNVFSMMSAVICVFATVSLRPEGKKRLLTACGLR